MKGIEFLRQGIGFNTREPRLLGRMGWFIGQKVGRADEKKQYRRLFKADDEFHERDRPGRTLPERDNWLVGREKYVAGQQIADSGAPLKTTALIFHSEPMMCAINYARALEDDGVFGDKARDGWKLANEEMRRFSLRDIPTTWDVPIRLGMREDELARAEALQGELEKLLPGRFKALEEEKRAALTAEERAALDVPPLERTDAQQKLAMGAMQAVRVDWPMVVSNAPAAVRDRARELLRQHVEAKETAEIIDRYREIVNFTFWRACCEAEVTETALKAREATWLGEREFQNARLQTAKQAFEEAFASWREVLDGSKVLREDSIFRDELNEVIDKYRKLLEQLDEPFPKDFILGDILKPASPDS
jgi:hypothetical protein